MWLLLAPRDYLSSYMKIGTIVLSGLGIVHRACRAADADDHPFVRGGGPIVPGPVWPFVCITIMCGAISGFHSLIGSGTTPKMVARSRDIRFIGYGAMLIEGFVALMALDRRLRAASPATTSPSTSPPDVFAKLGMPPVNLRQLSAMVGENLAGRTGGAVSLAVGMAADLLRHSRA